MNKKVAFITGASSGIGKSLAFKYAKENYNLVLAARNKTKLEEIKTEIEQINNTKVCVVPTDVTLENDCKNFIDTGIKEFGKIDVLINNAGISMRAILADLDLSVLKKVMDVNFWGAVYCTKYALNSLLENKGSVIGVSSIAGFKGLPGRTGYSASKFALQGFLESLRVENLKTGLHVLIASPGFTASNIRNTALNSDGTSQSETPRDEQKMMSSEEVADRIFSAHQKKKNYSVMTLNGKLTVLLNKLNSRFVDKLVFNHMSKEPGSPF